MTTKTLNDRKPVLSELTQARLDLAKAKAIKAALEAKGQTCRVTTIRSSPATAASAFSIRSSPTSTTSSSPATAATWATVPR